MLGLSEQISVDVNDQNYALMIVKFKI